MTSSMPRLVAHRGYPSRYPENTLTGIAAALRAGACYVEFDVQMTADGTPIVIHDSSLSRTAGDARCVLDCDWPALAAVSVHEPLRFGPLATPVPLPSLAQLVLLMRGWPDVQLLVELKSESLDRFGVDRVVNSVVSILAPIESRCVMISFSAEAVGAAKQRGLVAGWVIRQADAETLAVAQALQPDLLLINYRRMPEPLWPGPWQWGLYSVQSVEQAMALAHSGAALIETDAIGDLLSHPQWRPGSCHAR